MKTDIIISGGGIAGITLAILCAKAGKKVSLIEPNPPKSLKETQLSGRSIALLSKSVDILNKTGALELCADFIEPIKSFHLIDDSIEGKDTVEAKTSSKSPLPFNDFRCNVPNSILRAALWAKAREIETINIFENTSYEGHEIEGNFVNVALTDGRSILAKLLVGADGRCSAVRAASGLKMKPHDIGQSALTCLIEHTLPHNNVATEIHRIGGLLALVPSPKNTSSVVWMDKESELPKCDDVCAALQKASMDILGDIKIIVPAQTWPMANGFAKKTRAPRVAILAEAAHIFPPTGAQGLNLSLRDINKLARLVGVADDAGSDVVLKQYSRARAVDIAACVSVVTGANNIIRSKALPVRLARRSALFIAEKISCLRS